MVKMKCTLKKLPVREADVNVVVAIQVVCCDLREFAYGLPTVPCAVVKLSLRRLIPHHALIRRVSRVRFPWSRSGLYL